MKRQLLASFGAVSLAMLSALADGASISVDMREVRGETAHDLWGIFFEDIDLSIDGGVYAELVRNGSFEEGSINRWNKALPLAAWHPVGAAELNVREIEDDGGKRYRVASIRAKKGCGFSNEGFFGIAVKEGVEYFLSLRIRGNKAPISVSLDRTGAPSAATGEIAAGGGEWADVSLTLKAVATDSRCSLVFRTAADEDFEVDCVSLMPGDAVNGLWRRDVFERLAALKPRFLRFPGGCWVEGEMMKYAYRWKKTLPPRSERKPQWNLWMYWSSNSVGFYEYLLLAEALGAKPLFCINAGMSHKQNQPMDKMGEYVQDALDCIEFCNGDAGTKWGAVRAAMGHPKPFNLEYLEIGNENFGEAYDERYALYHDAIRAKYPEIKLIANFFKDWHVKSRHVEIEDIHHYETPEWFMTKGVEFYDKSDAETPFFVGEYAAQDAVGFWGDLKGAIGEAAFMVALERNPGKVRLAAYAPLIANVEHSVWAPNLIYVSTDTVFGSPSWTVQKLFAENMGETLLACAVDAQDSKFGNLDGKAIVADAVLAGNGDVVVKAVNCTGEATKVTLNVAGGKRECPYVRTVFGGEAADVHNSLYEPERLKEHTIRGNAAFPIAETLPPLSLSIYRFKELSQR